MKKRIFKWITIILVITVFLIVDFIIGKFPIKDLTIRGEVCLSSNGKYLFGDYGENVIQLKPLVNYLNYSTPVKQGFSKYRINSCGFRGEEISTKKHPDKIRIIVLGGSSVFGFKIYNDQETITGYLQGMNEHFEVINAGVIGYTSSQELSLFINYIVEFQPDILISYNLWNDVNTGIITDNYMGVDRLYNDMEKYLECSREDDSKIWVHFKRGVTNILLKSNIFRNIYINLKNRKWKKIQNEIDEKYKNSDKRQKSLDKTLEIYQGNILKMSQISKAFNIKYIVVIQPEAGISKNPEDRQKQLEIGKNWPYYCQNFPIIYAKSIEKFNIFAAEHSIPVLNLNKNELLINPSQSIFLDEVHNNSEGNRLIAEIIYRELLKQKYLIEKSEPDN